MRNKFADPASRRIFIEWILLISVLIFVGAVFIGVHLAEVKRADSVARDRLKTLTDIVADDLQANVETIDQTLEGVIHDYLSGPDATHSPSELTRRLRALQFAHPGVFPYLVVNANGIVTGASLPVLLGKR